ncbi:MAG: diadenylate cyclase [Thermoplasmata archaeon]|nr:diadenylate cyclase [Thermoplasmata archaeon]
MSGPMYTFTSACKLLITGERPTVVYMLTNDLEFVSEMMPVLQGTPLIVGTSSQQLVDHLKDRNILCNRIALQPELGLGVLDLARELVERAFLEGFVSVNDRVMCIVRSGIESTFIYDFKDIGLAHLKADVGKRVPVELMELVIQLAFQIAREGREGTPMGALLVVGDTDAVMRHSRPRIINPFQGHPEKGREIWTMSNWNTIKAYAQMDGATLIDDKGVARAAGRYMSYTWDVYLSGGLGGRHIAAASITKMTTAIAVVISSTSVVRVFKDGTEIYKASAY